MANLTIADLFTPDPSGVSLLNGSNAPTTTGTTWLSKYLTVGAQLGLSTTTWQPGDPTRTIISIASVVGAQEDVLVSQFNQGGFLDWAANGTVTYINTDGSTTLTYVTPDPSIPSQNPNGTPGWLDVLAYEVYDVQRLAASFASGPLYIVNENGSTYNYAAGTYHVANALTALTPPPTYSNVSAISVTPSPSTNITSLSVGGGVVTLHVGSSAGFIVGQIVFIDGTGTNADQTWQTLVSVTTGQVQFKSATVTGTASAGTLYAPAAFDFQADVVGPGSSASVGAITAPVTTQIGVDTYNAQAFVGQNWESNADLVVRCRAKLGALSPSGPAAAYFYFATTADQVLAGLAISVPDIGGGTTTVALRNGGIARALVQLDTSTGIVTVTIANAGGVTDGSVSNPIVSATATSPITIGVQNAHNAAVGDFVYIAGVQGLTGADGYWQIQTVPTGTTFTLAGSTGTGSYTTGGSAEIGDLGMVDLVIQENVVPDCLSEITQWAGVTTVTVGGTVYVPASQVTSYQAALASILTTYFATVPIGGIVNAEANNIIPIDTVIGLIYAAGIPGQGQSSIVKSTTGVTLNGVAADLTIPATNIPVLSGGITGITVVGV